MNNNSYLPHPKLFASLLFAFTVLPAASFADIVGYYVEGTVGQSMGDVEVYRQVSEFSADDTRLGITAGARFNDNFAIELGYYDFGEQTNRITDSLLPRQSADVSITNSVLGINAVGNYAITPRWYISGKFGFGFFNVDLDQVGVESGRTYNEKDRDFGMYYGAGTFYRFSRKYAVSAEVQQFFFDTPLFSEALVLNVAAVGFRWYF